MCRLLNAGGNTGAGYGNAGGAGATGAGTLFKLSMLSVLHASALSIFKLWETAGVPPSQQTAGEKVEKHSKSATFPKLKALDVQGLLGLPSNADKVVLQFQGLPTTAPTEPEWNKFTYIKFVVNRGMRLMMWVYIGRKVVKVSKVRCTKQLAPTSFELLY